jgi:hypothetical protein
MHSHHPCRHELGIIEELRIQNSALKAAASAVKEQVEFLQDTVAKECDEREVYGSALQ